MSKTPYTDYFNMINKTAPNKSSTNTFRYADYADFMPKISTPNQAAQNVVPSTVYRDYFNMPQVQSELATTYNKTPEQIRNVVKQNFPTQQYAQNDSTKTDINGLYPTDGYAPITDVNGLITPAAKGAREGIAASSGPAEFTYEKYFAELEKKYADERIRADQEAEKLRKDTEINSYADYLRSLATYGSHAELMAQKGLSGSGYSDYLSSQAYAQNRADVQTARALETQTKQDNQFKYADYFRELQLQKLQKAESDRLTAEAAKRQKASSAALKAEEATKQSKALLASVVDDISTGAAMRSDYTTYLDSLKALGLSDDDYKEAKSKYDTAWKDYTNGVYEWLYRQAKIVGENEMDDFEQSIIKAKEAGQVSESQMVDILIENISRSLNSQSSTESKVSSIEAAKGMSSTLSKSAYENYILRVIDLAYKGAGEKITSQGYAVIYDGKELDAYKNAYEQKHGKSIKGIGLGAGDKFTIVYPDGRIDEVKLGIGMVNSTATQESAGLQYGQIFKSANGKWYAYFDPRQVRVLKKVDED